MTHTIFHHGIVRLTPLFIGCLSLFIMSDREIRHITPPRLDTAHIAKKVLCHRPMRRGTPNMSVERIGKKVVAHNYGHGGSGWTIGYGAARHVNDLLEASMYGKFLHKDRPVTIVGAGIIGLLTAYDLLERGYTRLTVMAEQFDDLTSHQAGALFAQISMDNNAAAEPLITRLGTMSYTFYKDIAEGKNKRIPHGCVRILPAYFESREESGLEPYVGTVMQPAKDVSVDFGNGTVHDMVVYDEGIYINPYDCMHVLKTYLQYQGVTFVQKKIQSFAELADIFIINCTGMAAQELNADDAMVPVQGHLLLLHNQNPSDLDYMMLIHNEFVKTKSNFFVQRSLYLFPKQLPGAPGSSIGVLGGTFIEDATEGTPHEEEFDIILQSARQFYGIQ